MENDVSSLIRFYFGEAIKAGLCLDQSEFAKLIGVSRSTVNNALHGTDRAKNSKICEVACSALCKYGISITGDCSGNFCSVVGIDPKNFHSQDEWFGLLREKDKQISRLLGIIESFKS